MAFHNSRLWIGLNDISTEVNFVWMMDFHLLVHIIDVWYTNEPNGQSSNEDCVEMRSNFNCYWIDQSCTTLYNCFICNQPILKHEDGHYIYWCNFHHTNGDYFNI